MFRFRMLSGIIRTGTLKSIWKESAGDSLIKDEPEIGEAYGLFFERQKTCHRTLSNGDFGVQCD